MQRPTPPAAMDVIIATGSSGVPHSTFRKLPLADSTTFVEFSGTHKRYHAPLMVTLAREVGETAKRLERLAQTTLETILAEVRPGPVRLRRRPNSKRSGFNS